VGDSLNECLTFCELSFPIYDLCLCDQLGITITQPLVDILWANETNMLIIILL